MKALCWLIVGGLCGVTSWGQAAGQEWSRFRGPNGSGLSSATTIPARWTAKDYTWKVKLPGSGHSAPVVWGERIFVTCGDEKNGARILLCLRAADGKRLWSCAFPGERHAKHANNSFASATPAVDDGYVYVCWGSPKKFLVVAMNHDGKEAWRHDLGAFRSGHGFGASPIVHGDTVVVPSDQDGRGALYGLNRATGKIRWKVPRRSKATYTTPCIYQKGDGPAQVIFTNYEHGITAVDPKTGQVNWELDIFNKKHVQTAIGSPIVAGDLVIAISGWLGVRHEVVAVRPGERKKTQKAEEVYRITRSVPLCTTPLVKDDLLFLWADRGVVTCADARTGKVHWRERVPGSYYGSPICAGGRLYCMSREGEVTVVAAAKQFKLLARNPLGEGSHSTPAVSAGKMYLRTFTHLLAIGGKGQKQ